MSLVSYIRNKDLKLKKDDQIFILKYTLARTQFLGVRNNKVQESSFTSLRYVTELLAWWTASVYLFTLFNHLNEEVGWYLPDDRIGIPNMH